MVVPDLSSPPLPAFVGGVAWAVITAISHRLGQAEPLQQYHAGALVTVVVGALPVYLLERAGLSMVYSLGGFITALAVWMVLDRLLSSERQFLTNY